jgi:hypothetical protein
MDLYFFRALMAGIVGTRRSLKCFWLLYYLYNHEQLKTHGNSAYLATFTNHRGLK